MPGAIITPTTLPNGGLAIGRHHLAMLLENNGSGIVFIHFNQMVIIGVWSELIWTMGYHWSKAGSGSRAVVGLAVGVNLVCSLWLFAYAKTFAAMGRQGVPWSPLVLSQIICENVNAFFGLLCVSQQYLFPFLGYYYRNLDCLSKTSDIRLRRTLTQWANDGVVCAFLSNHILLLALTLDRIHGLSRPLDYKLRSEHRRCFLANAIAYGFGFIPLFAFSAYVNRINHSKINPAPGTWEDAVCLRRNQLATQCGWPLFAHAVEEASGLVAASSADPRYWYLGYHDAYPLCHLAGRREWRKQQKVLVLLGFALTLFMGVLVSIASLILLLLFRRAQANRVQVLGKKKKQAVELVAAHERLCTIVIIVETNRVFLLTSFVLVNTALLFLTSPSKAAIEAANHRISFALFLYFLFGSYIVTFLVFKSFRTALLELKAFKGLPNPKEVYLLLFAYSVLFSVSGFLVLVCVFWDNGSLNI